MRPFKNSKGSFYTMNILLIKLVVWLGWLSCVAVGQLELSEAVTGFVNFPEVGISCIGNLAVLITSISKGRLDLEMGVRDVLASTRGPILRNINGINGEPPILTTCPEHIEKDEDQASVLMLSYNTPNSSTKDFMKYISNAHKVHSILLECLPFNSPEHEPEHTCKCIEIRSTVEQITNLHRSETEEITNLHRSETEEITNLLKPLPNSQCLLPSAGCLRNGCHNVGNEGTLNVDAACEILEMVEDSVQKTHTCICIPLKAAADDRWTKLLTKSFRSKDTEERRVSVMASDAMEIYTTQDANNTYRARRKREWLREGLTVEFNTTSLILPRLTEILINFLLVGWFKVDGFSSSMVARKAVKKYVVGSEKSGFAANAFLSRALVKSEECKDKNATDVRHVCQVLTFRRCFLRLRCLSYLAGGVGLVSGKIVFGKWVYSAVQALVWVKWGIGSYLLGESSAAESNSAYNWGSGVLVYSSAFFLNSVLAGVRCEWKYLPSGSDSPANSPTMSPPG